MVHNTSGRFLSFGQCMKQPLDVVQNNTVRAASSLLLFLLAIHNMTIMMKWGFQRQEEQIPMGTNVQIKGLN